MGITVALVDEHAKPLVKVRDIHDFVDEAIGHAPDSGLLRFVDPYGHLTLNKPQCAVFLREWETLRPLAKSDHEKHTWQQIADLARTCEEEPHVYLRFSGD